MSKPKSTPISKRTFALWVTIIPGVIAAFLLLCAHTRFFDTGDPLVPGEDWRDGYGSIILATYAFYTAYALVALSAFCGITYTFARAHRNLHFFAISLILPFMAGLWIGGTYIVDHTPGRLRYEARQLACYDLITGVVDNHDFKDSTDASAGDLKQKVAQLRTDIQAAEVDDICEDNSLTEAEATILDSLNERYTTLIGEQQNLTSP